MRRIGRLDRVVEGLPDDKALAARKTQGHGLTRPELAVLLAYAKMHIYEELLETKAPDDPSFERELIYISRMSRTNSKRRSPATD